MSEHDASAIMVLGLALWGLGVAFVNNRKEPLVGISGVLFVFIGSMLIVRGLFFLFGYGS